MFRTLTPRQLAFDVITAALCVLLRLAIGMNSVPMLLVVIAMAAALGLRRVSPALALVVAWAGAIVQVTFGQDPDVSNFAILPVLYATASYGTPRVKWIGLVSSGAGAAVIALYLILRDMWGSRACGSAFSMFCFEPARDPHWQFSLLLIFLFALVVFLLSWTFGLLAKTWRGARASSLARIIAERQRIDAEQDVVIEQERNRIARDMHDVVAHSLAVVIAQADGARYAGRQDPDAVDESLRTIAGTARQALGEVRVLLGQLRHSQGEAPQPTLADLGRLLDQLRSSGLRIEFVEEGDPVPIAAGLELAAYRIVQEALTNALRHGDTAEEVTVRVEWGADSIAVTVTNATAPAAGAAVSQEAVPQEAAPQEVAGHRIAGMRERAALWGGTFQAGPAAGNRYVVKAVLPIREITETLP
jgi:signal transduction histidine kinase